jgi:hypothetical protein
MRTTILAIFALMGCAPTPSDLVPGAPAVSGCSYKLSGAITESGSCTVAGEWSPSKSDLEFTVGAKSGGLSFGGNLSTTKQFTSRTWDNGNVLAGAGQNQQGNAVWAFVLNATNHDPPDQGSFSLTIDDPGMETVSSDASVWLSPKGKLTINMPAVPNSGASGVTTAEVSFN